MKNGRVHKDVTLIKETKTTYTFLTHAGARLTLRKASVEKIEKKPTVRGEFMKRQKKVGKRDADGLVELAAWAQHKGMKKDASKLLKRALSVDRNHQKAHTLLGDKLYEGKWISEAEWNRKNAKALEKKYKALGWKKSGGKWLNPVEFYRKEKKLVQVQGHWVDPKLAKEIAKNQLVWLEGDWITAEDKKKADTGYRKLKKRWWPIEDLDERHAEFDDPWVLKGEFVEVHSNARHKDARKILKWAEGYYESCRSLFGMEHRDLYDEDKGRLVVVLGRGVKSYQFLGKNFTREDRIAHKSSGYGSFYAPTYGQGRGGGCTYLHGDLNWVQVWVGNAVTHSYIARMSKYMNTDEKTLEALAGYIAGTRKGKYAPTRWFHWRYLNSPGDRPIGAAHGMYDRIGYTTEHTLCQAGFLLHFLREKNETAFREFWNAFIAGDGVILTGLVRQCFANGGEIDAQALDQEFRTFHEAYNKSFKPSPDR